MKGLRRRSLAHRLDALSADILLPLDAINGHTHPLNVDIPAALGVAHRVADVVPELWPLAANITLGHNVPPSNGTDVTFGHI